MIRARRVSAIVLRQVYLLRSNRACPTSHQGRAVVEAGKAEVAGVHSLRGLRRIALRQQALTRIPPAA